MKIEFMKKTKPSRCISNWQVPINFDWLIKLPVLKPQVGESNYKLKFQIHCFLWGAVIT